MTTEMASEAIRGALLALIVIAGAVLVGIGRVEVADVETPTAMVIGYLVALPQRLNTAQQESHGTRQDPS